MFTFRTLITPTPIQPDKPPDQFFSLTVEGARAELKKWVAKGHHGRYRIMETVEVVVEEGEC